MSYISSDSVECMLIILEIRYSKQLQVVFVLKILHPVSNPGISNHRRARKFHLGVVVVFVHIILCPLPYAAARAACRVIRPQLCSARAQSERGAK